MKKFLSILITLFILAFFFGCSPKKESTNQFIAMDTYMELKAYGHHSKKAIDLATDEINRLDLLLSTGNSESEISRLNSLGYGYVSDDTSYIIEEALLLGSDTNGALNIAIYPLMELWGFTTHNYSVPSKSSINNILPLTRLDNIIFAKETNTIILKNGATLDLGAIAKGYTSDRVIDIFRKEGINSAIISLGQNVQALGRKPNGKLWTVGIKNPDTNDKRLGNKDIIGTLSVEDKAVISSGDYERFFIEDGKKYHHILNPSTGYPANMGLTSVTVVSKIGILADGLSTALFVMGKDDALEYWRNHKKDFDAIFIEKDGKITITEGIVDCFSSELEYEVGH